MSLGVQGWGRPPGQDALRETFDQTLVWGPSIDNVLLLPRKIPAATVDAGNTPTTILRAGMLFSITTTQGTPLIPLATGGAGVIGDCACILAHSVSTLQHGTAQDLWVGVIVAGPVVAARLIDSAGVVKTPGGWKDGGAQQTAVLASLAADLLSPGRFILDEFDLIA